MSLFRKQPQTASPSPEPQPQPSQPQPQPQLQPLSDAPQLFNASHVEIAAIYQFAKLTADELDRVARAEELLHSLPKKESVVREVVEATFRAFGVDQAGILDAAKKQSDALESFIRFSHDHTQRILDASSQRITELQAEIERCRHAAEQAKREGEDRARTVNNELIKVQHVLEFFGEGPQSEGLDEPTFVTDNDRKRTGKAVPAPLPPAPGDKPVNRRE